MGFWILDFNLQLRCTAAFSLSISLFPSSLGSGLRMRVVIADSSSFFFVYFFSSSREGGILGAGDIGGGGGGVQVVLALLRQGRAHLEE